MSTSMLLRWSSTITLLLMFSLHVNATVQDASSANSQDPYKIMHIAADATFERIKNERTVIDKNPEQLRTIMREELMQYVDPQFSAFKVLGNQARKVNKEELVTFVSVFEEYLVATYATALSLYTNEVIEFEPAASFANKSVITIKALIKSDTRPDIHIAFKLRKNKKTSEWLIYDLIAEGISLLSSKQTEFEPILRKEGVGVAITKMQHIIDKPINLPNS